MATRNRDSFNEINITPLTDIFLVLLIIMMVIAPMLDQQGLNLLVPGEEAQDNKKQESKIITVEVGDDNQYTLDGQSVTPDSLIFKIKNAYQSKKDGLMIQTSPNATHSAVVKVMDSARNAGVTSISLDQK